MTWNGLLCASDNISIDVMPATTADKDCPALLNGADKVKMLHA